MINKLFTKSVLVVIGVLALSMSILMATSTATSEKSASFDDVKKDSAELIESIKSYTVAQKDEAVRDASQMLTALDSRIESMENELEAQWNELSEASRRQYRNSIREMQKQRVRVAEWYGEMRQSSASAWDDVKHGFIEAYEVLENAWEDAESEFDKDSSG